MKKKAAKQPCLETALLGETLSPLEGLVSDYLICSHPDAPEKYKKRRDAHESTLSLVFITAVNTGDRDTLESISNYVKKWHGWYDREVAKGEERFTPKDVLRARIIALSQLSRAGTIEQWGKVLGYEKQHDYLRRVITECGGTIIPSRGKYKRTKKRPRRS